MSIHLYSKANAIYRLHWDNFWLPHTPVIAQMSGDFSVSGVRLGTQRRGWEMLKLMPNYPEKLFVDCSGIM